MGECYRGLKAWACNFALIVTAFEGGRDANPQVQTRIGLPVGRVAGMVARFRVSCSGGARHASEHLAVPLASLLIARFFTVARGPAAKLCCQAQAMSIAPTAPR